MRLVHTSHSRGDFLTYQLTFAVTLCVALAAPATAQTIANVTVEPATAKVGEPVKVTANFDNAENPNCNVRVNFGDGVSKNFKINQTKDVPLVATHTYTKAGEFKVRAEGKTALPMLKCNGVTKSALVKVAAPTPVAAARPAGPSCPQGWKLNAASVNKKSGAYTCTTKAGTTLPATKLECPGALGYFENKAKGQLGCRP
jgi:hypothetical protein